MRVIDGPTQPNPLTLVDIFNAINLHLLNVAANIHQSPNHHKDSKLPGNKYCLIIITVIDLTGRDLWFTLRFWIFTTEFFVIIELFHKIKRQNLMELSMDLWHQDNTISYFNILNAELCSLCPFFLYWFFSYYLQSS